MNTSEKENIITGLIIIIYLTLFIKLITNSAEAQEKKEITTTDSPIYVGVLENYKTNSYLRLAFRYFDNEWLPLCNYNTKTDGNNISPLSWSIVYCGKIIGKARSVQPKNKQDYSELNLYLIDPTLFTPRIGRLSNEFLRWTNEPQYRPLIAISDSNRMKLYQWNSIILQDSIKKRIIRCYRNIVGDQVKICSFDKEISDSIISYSYKDSDLLFDSSYSINNKLIITSIYLDEKLNHCDGPGSEVWSACYYLIDSIGNIFQLGANAHNISESEETKFMKFVDMGDFNSDGKNEAIFWRSGYDEDGYVLFYDDFKKHIVCSWNYH